MTQKAPGKAHRKGLTFVDIARMFPDDATAEAWFVRSRWPDGVHCPACGSLNIQARPTRKPQPYRCRDCRKDFSTKTGTLMEGSKLGFQVWAIATYLLTTNIKGVSSMRLHRELGVTQKTAWHLAHRIRETWEDETPPFSGPVEVDETYIGGKRKNMHAAKRRTLKGRGAVGKEAVAGVRDRDTGKVSARVVSDTDASTLQGFVRERTTPGATVYTDESRSYGGLGRDRHHEAVCHSVGQYVDGQASTNGMESFWSMMKRGYHGVYHKMSPEHLDRYVTEFSGRHNDRERNTEEQMVRMVEGMVGKRLRYRDLIAK